MAAVILYLFAGGSAQASPPAEAPPVSDFIIKSQRFRLFLEANAERITTVHTLEVAGLSAEARELVVPLPFPAASIKTWPASCRRGRDGALVVAFQHRLVVEPAPRLEIAFDEPLPRYQTCLLQLEYTHAAAGLLRTWVEEERPRTEVRFSLGSATAKETAIEVVLPGNWSLIEATPGARVQTVGRTTTVGWNLSGSGPPGERSFFLSLSPQGGGDWTSPLLLVANLVALVSSFSGAVVVSSRRDLRGVWQVETRAIRVLGRLLAAWRPSEAVILALKNLSRRKARSLMTFVGVLLGGATLSVQAFSAAVNLETMGELGLEAHLYAMVGITLGVCFYYVATTMLNAVQERRAEVGVLKAVGFGSGWVLRLFLLESLFLGLVAGGGGAALGFVAVARPYLMLDGPKDAFWLLASVHASMIILLLTLALARSKAHLLGGSLLAILLPALALATQLTLKSNLPLSPATGGLVYGATVVFVALICAGGGLYPAWKASRLYPVEALR